MVNLFLVAILSRLHSFANHHRSVTQVLINYGDEWQKAWDEHVKSWKPIPPESDYNNLTMYAKPSATSNGKDGYIRAEVFNEDEDTPLRTMEEQIDDPYPTTLQIRCKLNINHRGAYLHVMETIPFFTREFNAENDIPDDSDDKHVHNCNITDRYPKEDEEESSDDEEEEEYAGHEYLYSVTLEVQKEAGENDEAVTELHEVEMVPRRAFEFANLRYTSDVFLKGAFRHEMILPDELFPKAWMNKEGV